MLAVIGGSSLLTTSLFRNMDAQTVRTPHGEATVFVRRNLVYLQRHGPAGDTPPHRINYKANISAIKKMGISNIIAVNSTGSLKKKIRPGSLLVPDDYFNLFDIPTFFDNQLKFTIPGLNQILRNSIISIARRHRIKIIPNGVYFQVHGPVLETKAEITFAKKIGDVVGMTMAKEAILAKEIQLGYASLCTIDNYANGISDEPLTLEEIDRVRESSLKQLEALLRYICEELTTV